jgi:GH24 family phage-related lysozyme (muramidase)
MAKIRSHRGLGYIPSPHVYDFIKEMEGDMNAQRKLGSFRRGRFYLYNDAAAHTTIGYGHKLTAEELRSGVFRNGLTPEQADKLLKEDVRKAARAASEHFGAEGWEMMSQEQKDAAIDHAFNLGPTGLKRFPRWSKALREGDWKTVRKEAKRHYKNSRTKEWVALSKRNAAYDAMFVEPNIEAPGEEKRYLEVAQAEPEEIASILEKHSDKNFVRRILDPENSPKLYRGKDDEGNDVHSTHSMSWSSNAEGTKHYVYPTVVQREEGGELEDLGEFSPDYARVTGEYIEFDTAEEADDFSKNYKKVWEKPSTRKLVYSSKQGGILGKRLFTPPDLPPPKA